MPTYLNPIGQERYDRARQLIPGAPGLFGFRQEMYAPASGRPTSPGREAVR